jgi:ubiquinone/menaquinone biosynthesis C-methylase UbiE
LAPKFDVTPFRTPDEILRGLAAILGPPLSIDSALDVCCGTGAVIGVLRPLCRQRVVGIDFSQGMLDVARQRFPDTADETRVELVRGDVLDMSFRKEFDLAVTTGSLGHILPRDEPRFVERIHAALKPGGRFVFVTGYMPPWYSRPYLFSRAFNAAMHVRNAIHRPHFIMYYLTFLLPHAEQLLRRHHFDVAIHDLAPSNPHHMLKVVVATRQAR